MASRIPVPTDAPDWWKQAVAPELERQKAERASRPTLLARYADTASLPAAASFPGGLAFHVALGVPVISDGAFWWPVSVGAHL